MAVATHVFNPNVTTTQSTFRDYHKNKKIIITLFFANLK